MRGLAGIVLLTFLTTACSTHRSSSVVFTQNGLQVTTTFHRHPQNRNLRIVTVEVKDATSRRPINDAEVGIEALGLPVVRARNKGNGSYEATFDAAATRPRSSIGVAVVAHGTNLVFHLRRSENKTSTFQ